MFRDERKSKPLTIGSREMDGPDKAACSRIQLTLPLPLKWKASWLTPHYGSSYWHCYCCSPRCHRSRRCLPAISWAARCKRYVVAKATRVQQAAKKGGDVASTMPLRLRIAVKCPTFTNRVQTQTPYRQRNLSSLFCPMHRNRCLRCFCLCLRRICQLACNQGHTPTFRLRGDQELKLTFW